VSAGVVILAILAAYFFIRKKNKTTDLELGQMEEKEA
jgi:hypothetical protein